MRNAFTNLDISHSPRRFVSNFLGTSCLPEATRNHSELQRDRDFRLLQRQTVCWILFRFPVMFDSWNVCSWCWDVSCSIMYEQVCIPGVECPVTNIENAWVSGANVALSFVFVLIEIERRLGVVCPQNSWGDCLWDFMQPAARLPRSAISGKPQTRELFSLRSLCFRLF